MFNMCGRRPLDEACMRNFDSSVEVLLSKGAQPYRPPCCSFQFCRENPGLLQLFVKYYPVMGDATHPSLVYVFVQLGQLPLTTEVSSWPDVVVNVSETHNGYNLMHRISQTKNREFLHLLLPKFRASPDELADLINTEVDGGTCLWLALPDYHLIEDLRKLGGDISLLTFVNCYRIYQSHKLLIHYLLREGLNIDDTDEYGKSAFRYACEDFHVAMQLELIKMGCDVNSGDRDGVTPLHEACLKGYFVQAKLLLRHGANPALSTNKGETALDLVQKPYRGKTVSVAKKLVLLLKSHAEGTFIE